MVEQMPFTYLGIAIFILRKQGTKVPQVHPALLNPHLPLPQAVPARITWRRPLMPRRPYSVAVLSTRGRLHPRFLREERLGEKGGTFLKGKEGRVGFRTQLLFHHIPEEQGITDDISAPHTLRLLD